MIAGAGCDRGRALRSPLVPLAPLALLAFTTFGDATPAHASGYLLYEQSAAALAQGGAVLASTDEPAAVWFNPAALVFLPRYGVAATTALAYGRIGFSPRAGGPEVSSRPSLQPVPNLFAHVRIADRVHLGLGLYAPFGLAIDWPEGWIGAERALSIRIAIAAVNPTVAVRLAPGLSIAAGASLLRGHVTYGVALPRDVGGRGDLAGDAWSWNANVALAYRPPDSAWQFGLCYRTGAALDFSGRADFSPVDATLDTTFADQAVHGRLRLPDVAGAGASYQVNSRLRLSAELDFVRWSVFDRLEIKFKENTTPNQTIERNSRDAFTGRLGAEWRAPGSAFAYRAGAVFDQSTARSESLAPSAPDANRLGTTVGFGFHRGGLAADIGYLFLYFLPARAVGGREGPEGTYRATAHILSLTVGYQAR